MPCDADSAKTRNRLLGSSDKSCAFLGAGEAIGELMKNLLTEREFVIRRRTVVETAVEKMECFAAY